MNNLYAGDAVYHQVCSINFRTGKQTPLQFLDEETQPLKRQKKGKPNDSIKADAFIRVVEHLQSHDDEQTTIHELIEIMRTFLPVDIEPYGFTYMKSSIQDHFGDSILITEINGKSNVVTFRYTADSVINEFYSQPHSDDSYVEKLKIVQKAAKLLQNDIKRVEQ